MRLFPRREVAALVDLVEVTDVGVDRIDPAARCPPDLAGEGGEADRERDLRRSLPGREVVQNRVDISPEAPVFKHLHPGEEIIYVLQGSLEYQVEGKPPTTLEAGEVFFVPAETIHAVKNVGTTNAAELATYVVEKGKPLLVLAE